MRKVMARANNTPGPAAIALTRSMAMAPVEDSSFDKELETAHDMIRNKIDTKFGSLRKAFRAIDEDGTGKVRPAPCHPGLYSAPTTPYLSKPSTFTTGSACPK